MTHPANAITIRRMELADLEQVMAIERSSFSSPWPPKIYHFELTENQTAHLWVAEVDSERQASPIVGMTVVWLHNDEAHIATLAVKEDHRRQGIGFQLICTALGELTGMGALSAVLEVRTSNDSAQDLYQRLGFEQAGIKTGYYTDNGEDAALMRLKNMHFDNLIFRGCS